MRYSSGKHVNVPARRVPPIFGSFNGVLYHSGMIRACRACFPNFKAMICPPLQTHSSQMKFGLKLGPITGRHVIPPSAVRQYLKTSGYHTRHFLGPNVPCLPGHSPTLTIRERSHAWQLYSETIDEFPLSDLDQSHCQLATT
jgi:hypothetical protein